MTTKCILVAVLLLCGAQSFAASTILTAASTDEAADAIIHATNGFTIDSYTGHMLVMSKEVTGATGYLVDMLKGNGAETGEHARIEYVFTLIQTKSGTDVFGHANSTLLLSNGNITRSRLDNMDRSVQSLLDNIKGNTK